MKYSEKKITHTFSMIIMSAIFQINIIYDNHKQEAERQVNRGPYLQKQEIVWV